MTTDDGLAQFAARLAQYRAEAPDLGANLGRIAALLRANADRAREDATLADCHRQRPCIVRRFETEPCEENNVTGSHGSQQKDA
jgi:hypothetical protein